MRRTARTFALGAMVAALAMVAAACGGGDGGGSGGQASEGASPSASGSQGAAPGDGPTITVGSFNFPESNVLAEIYGQALRNAGYSVEIKHDIGSREVTQPALTRGDIDFIPEYTGNALRFQKQGEDITERDPQKVDDDLQQAYQDENITALQMSDAQDVDALAVTQETANQYDLKKVSDLQGVADQMVFGGGPECEDRLSCFKGYEQTYDLNFKSFKSLDTAGPITVAALKSGEVDVANLFSTQGVIEANNFVVLEDDKNLQLPQNIVPVVSNEIVDAYGQDFKDLVNSVTEQLTTDGLTQLNKRVEVDKDDASAAAKDWLAEHDFGQG